MTITDLAPEPLHVVRREGTYVVTGGHIRDFTHAQEIEFEAGMARLLEQVACPARTLAVAR